MEISQNGVSKRRPRDIDAYVNRGLEMEEMHAYNASNRQQKLGFEEFDEQPRSRTRSTVDDVKVKLLKPIQIRIDSRWNEYCTQRRAEKSKMTVHRKGPAPIEDAEGLRNAASKSTYGTLDSDVEDLEFEDNRARHATVRRFSHPRLSISNDGSSLASCRALIIYFSKLAKSNNDYENVDLNFFEALLQSGADINFSDRHGQTIMHEISRAWHPDVALFAIQHNANVNKSDLYGRTPLHLAAAVDYTEMVEFLVKHGANINAVTKGEKQTAIHYAAKNNAVASLKSLLSLGAHINARDYKMRTPLFVASEAARPEAAQFLVERGAPVGVYDDSGTPCLSFMIEKMPHVAIEAVEQFHNIDRAFRKHYFYLSYLEKDSKFLEDPEPPSKREKQEKKEREKENKRIMKEKGMKVPKPQKTFAKIPIEVILQYNQLDLIMHPVFQRLLHVKWNLFGKWGTIGLVAINLFYTLIWTVLGIWLPRKGASYYTPLSSNWWRLLLEIIGLLLTGYFMYTEIKQFNLEERTYNKWRQWRTREIEKDIDYCHPRWPEEKKYLDSELQQVRTYQRTYFRQPWNIFEWLTYLVVIALVITRIIAVASPKSINENVHPQTYAIGLIFIWLRLMRSCRGFRSLGPFIAILGSVIANTLKFGFLFFEFFTPYTVGFWIIFGGSEHGKKMGENSKDWQNFNDLVFSVWQMTLIGNINWDGLVAVHRVMAQVLVGTYFALAGVVCMNLYIALLSDTFSRVYARALANAVMQQAHIILSIEKSLSKEKRIRFGHYFKNECGPLEVYSRDEGTSTDAHDSKILEKAVHHVNVRIDELEDKLYVGFSHHRTKDGGQIGGTGTRSGSFIGGGGGGGGGHGGDHGGPAGGAINFSQFNHSMNRQNRQMGLVQQEVSAIKQLVFQMRKEPPSSHSVQSHLPHLLDIDRAMQPNLLGAIPRVSSMESSQIYAPGTSDQQQQQQQQPFISQGPNFFEARQSQDGQTQYADSRSGLPDNYPQSDPMRSQRSELEYQQDPPVTYSLPRTEYTTEAVQSIRSKSV